MKSKKTAVLQLEASIQMPKKLLKELENEQKRLDSCFSVLINSSQFTEDQIQNLTSLHETAKGHFTFSFVANFLKQKTKQNALEVLSNQIDIINATDKAEVATEKNG